MLSNQSRSKSLFVQIASACLAVASCVVAVSADAQVIMYETFRPVAPVVAPAYVANYTPAGNYAAVTAFSPPVYSAPVPVAATVPTSSVGVTSYYAPAMAATAVPVTSYYAPVTSYYAPVTSYYAPVTAAYAPVAAVAPVATTAYYAPVEPVVAAPVTAYYAPAAVAVPLYRRGLFGGLRPLRTAWYYPY